MADTARKMMPCASCGRAKDWKDGFPTNLYAECWQCVWDRHIDMNHRPKRHWHLRWPLHRDPLDKKANGRAALDTEAAAAGPMKCQQMSDGVACGYRKPVDQPACNDVGVRS